MAVLASIATGNFLTAGTWGVVDSTSYLNAENATESLLTTAYSGTRSSAFTPGAIVVSHIGVKLCERIGTTGTISVCLELDSDNSLVAGTEVTINVADLPSALEADLNGGWIFFKLATPVTLSAATAYQVAAKTSSATMVDLWCDGTADNLARALITTTTQAPAAGDDLIVAGEHTGAGTGNSFVVTMNETAATDYGAASTSLVTPALAICKRGTLQYATGSAANPLLRLSGNAIIYADGTLNIGTTGTPIPRDSVAVLEFDCAADGDFGLTARNGSTLNIQGLSRTSGKDITYCLLNTDEAVDSTSLGVDTDTGWLDNDEIVVAGTGRSATESERGALDGNAGASSLTVDGFAGVGGGIANAHLGTSPRQAEVILLTRNVKIRSVSSTAMSFVDVDQSPTVDIDWAEFYYIGNTATGKNGIVVGVTTGSFNMHYSSVHDTENYGLFCLGTANSVGTIEYCTFYSLNTAGGSSTYGIGLNNQNFSNNVVIDVYGGGSGVKNGINIAGSGAALTFNNNRIATGRNSDSTYGTIGFSSSVNFDHTFSNNVIHSCNGIGVGINGNTSTRITFDGWIVWRNDNEGIALGDAGTSRLFDRIVLKNCDIFENDGSNIRVGLSSTWPTLVRNFILENCDIDSGSPLSTTIGISLVTGFTYVKMLILNCNFSQVTAHSTSDIAVNTSSTFDITAINTNFGATTEITAQTSWPKSSIFRSQKHDGSLNTTKTLMRHGTVTADQTTRHTASGHSWKMTPNNATEKLRFPGETVYDTFKVAVAASSEVTITVYVYEDASYNGNRARLVVVGGIIGGIANDVTDTATAASDEAWEQLSVAATPNEAGVIEFYIDCDGTAGNLYVDDVSVSQA